MTYNKILNLNDELYYDPINNIILCRKYKFNIFSIVSITNFIDDTKTTIILYETYSKYFENFIKIDYNKLYSYNFLIKSDIINAYKSISNIDYINIPNIYKLINFKYYENQNKHIIEYYLKKEKTYRKFKLKRLL